MSNHAKHLLKGGYDMHVHPAPSHLERKMDDWEYAALLDQYGMAGAVIKKHFGATTDRAFLVNAHGGFQAKLYGSITLDWPVGGLNPYAVRSELMQGCKLVFLPTFHANSTKLPPPGIFPIDGPPISVLDDKGEVRREVLEIMDCVKEFGAVLCTGHLPPNEVYKVTKTGLRRGCKMVLTHPDGWMENICLDWQIELTQLGAYADKCWLDVFKGHCSVEECVKRIRGIGTDRCVLITDFGQKANPDPCEGMMNFVDTLLESGFSDAEIQQMVQSNPKTLLDV